MGQLLLYSPRGLVYNTSLLLIIAERVMKDVIISITGAQYAEQSADDAVELVTDGKYCFKNGRGKLVYTESELTGMEGTTTSFLISPGEVILDRKGTLTSRMVFREGAKSTFLYDTPYGSTTMGLDTHSIRSTLGERGGDLEIDYVVDFDHAVVGRNSFKINVKEQRGGVNDGKSC